MSQRKTINELMTGSSEDLARRDRIQSKKIHDHVSTPEEREDRARRYALRIKNAKLGTMGQALIKAGLISE